MPEPSISVTPIPNTELKKITLKNDELTVVLLNYGARLHQIFAPDNKGHLENVLLSYDELSDVLKFLWSHSRSRSRQNPKCYMGKSST